VQDARNRNISFRKCRMRETGIFILGSAEFRKQEYFQVSAEFRKQENFYEVQDAENR